MDGQIRITIKQEQGRSCVRDLFVSPPFRIVSVGQRMPDKAAYLMIMSTSPGMLSGDNYHIAIKLEEQTRLQLQSQSYQRLFHMKEEAVQRTDVYLAKKSAFSYVPHPIVPHTNAIFKGINTIHLEKNAQLILGEIITCGRKHYGELFAYKYFSNRTEIYHNNQLLVKDNILLKPDSMPLTALGLLENYTHQATLICVDTYNPSLSYEIEYIHKLLNQSEEKITFGISQLNKGGIMIRILGNGSEALYQRLKMIEDYFWHQKINP